MSENKIDELFKKGLTESDIPFDEAHWRDMKKKLQQDDNRRRDIIYWTSLGGAAAMLIMAFAWWILPVNVQKNNVVKNNTAEIKKQLPAKNIEKATSEAIELQQPVVRNVSSQNSPAVKVTMEQNLPVINNAIFDNGGISAEQNAGQQNNLVTAIRGKEDNSAPRQAAEVQAKDPAVTPAAATTPVLVSQSTKPVIKDDSSRISVKKPGFKPALILSITASPDLSAVNSFSNTKRGFNGGILATVSLSSRLSVTTGAVLAKKVYDTPFSNYKPVGSYIFPVTPADVSADCRVLDIPLNLNYNFVNKKSTKIGLSAGASSYLMLSERYGFQYQNPYARSPKSYYVRNQNQHYLGVANLAVSYEKKLNNNASIALQPFAKLPLTQIGNGNVKLMSAGVSVNLNINVSNITGKKP